MLYSINSNIYNKYTVDHFRFFCDESLTNIVFSSSLTSIGKYSFKHCTNLLSITLPNYTKILDEDSFANCTNITSIALNNNLLSVNTCSFEYCT